MRYRQIHLDFHTSERIPGIGSRFDARDFARTLADANVDSVTVFSKCHHGWSYHPTKVGKQHPNLDFDLLRAQIDALHGAGINAPVYISAGWDELAAREHPGWRVVTPEGKLIRQRGEPLGPGWAFLDFNSPYLDYLCRQVEEAMELFPDGDGIFIDICFALVSASTWAQTKMEAEGLDWTDPDDRVKFTEATQINFFDRVSGAVRKHDPKMPLFFNFGHVRRGRRDILKYFSHLEIESLPTAFWGYEHFPVSARYVETLGIPFLGMTGKFHHLWGEVGGYKKPEALLYECGAMLAQGAACSVGDHLHPTGAIDKTTYRTISGGLRPRQGLRALGGRLAEPRRDRRHQHRGGIPAAARRHSRPSCRRRRRRGAHPPRRPLYLRPPRSRVGPRQVPPASSCPMRSPSMPSSRRASTPM